jgi:hypothetical protein
MGKQPKSPGHPIFGAALGHMIPPVPLKTVTECLVEHLERAGFVVRKWQVIGGGAALARGFEGSRPRRGAIPNPVLCWVQNQSD